MSLNNMKVFIDDNYFISFDRLANNSIITLGDFRYAIKSDSTNKNPVYCSIRGKYLPQITDTLLDETTSVGSFAYVTEPNGKCYIKLAIANDTVEDVKGAMDYVRGMLVDYALTDLVGTGTCQEPLFELTTYLSDGTIVSPTIAMPLNEIAKRIYAFENNFNLNEVGFYRHVIQRAITKK